MSWLIPILLMNPLAGAAVLSFGRNLKESTVSKLVSVVIFFQWLLVLALSAMWFMSGAKAVEQLFFPVYSHGEFEFNLYYLIDHLSIAGLITISTIFLLVTRFSRYYLHRDVGYQRYFAILLLFLTGLTILMIAGNIDFLFAGWELLGVSSFLLIGFYHHRLSAIRNSLFVFGVYRLTDIGLILGAWLKKSVIEEGHRFFILQSIAGTGTLDAIHPHADVLLSSLIILSAIGKSAQFPISFWLSRAMEGPTSSSAIFYGALSLHAGVFLLLRTYDFWFLTWETRLLVFVIGLITVFICGLASQTQSNIKGRLAYAASFHVGLQFIELSLGFPNFALAHVIGHMIVRCYQFLISPAVVSYGLRVQNFASSQKTHVRDRFFFALPKRVQRSLYVFSFNEGYLEPLIHRFFLHPFAKLTIQIGQFGGFLFLLAFLFSSVSLLAAVLKQPLFFNSYVGWLGITTMCLLSLAAFGQIKNVFQIWNSIGLGNFMMGLFVLFSTHGHFEASPWFLISIFFFWLFGFVALKGMFFSDSPRSLERFYAYSSTHPTFSHILLLSFLGISGFPLFPAFLGEDIVLHSLVGPFSHFAILGVLVLMLNGITAARLYTRVCWGPTSSV